METIEIIKEAFIFPSQNIEKLAIYILVTFVLAIFVAGGAILSVLGVNQSFYLIFAFILFILGVVVALIITGY